MKQIFVILLLIGAAFNASAREYEILGRIFDANTEQRLGNARLTVVDPVDGTIHGEGVDSYYGPKPNKENWFIFNFWTEGSDSLNLLLRINQPGYKPKAIPLKIGHGTPKRIELNEPIWMVSDTSALTAEMVRELKEVSVVGTRIKMVVRGDTLVYDAAAFQLSEGSMLDALVSQLPGVALDNQGRITVNGKFVSSLLVDGKDFFSGDPNIALKNLPAYIVKNIKVYNRQKEFNRKSPGMQTEEDIVMDVRLKKQYQQGFLANLEGGYGSGNKYQGRIFALEYARNGRIGFFANVNNINNDSRGPGLWDENWRENRSNDGDRRIVKAGIDWQWTFHQEVDSLGVHTKSFGLDGTATYTLEHKNLTEMVSTTQFLTDGNRYGRTVSDTRSRDEQLYSQLYIWGVPKKNLSIYIQPSFKYQTGRFTTFATEAEFAVNPHETSRGEAIDSVRGSVDGRYANDNLLIYRENLNGMTTRRAIGTDGNLNISIGNAYLYGRMLNVYFDWDYNSLRYRDNVSRMIDYRLNHTDDIHRNLLTSAPGYNLKLSPSVRAIKKFDYEKGQTELTLLYRMGHGKEQGEQAVYALSDPDMPLDQAMMDATNSFYSLLTTTDNGLNADVKMTHRISNDWMLNLQVGQQLKYLHRNLHYDRAAIDTVIVRNTVMYTPQIWLTLTHESRITRKYELFFKAENTPVNMTRLFNTTDNTDPLNIFLGNPALRGSTTYTGMLRYEQRQSLAERVLSAQLNYYNYSNRVGQLKIYNPTNGVSTFMPVNVKGSYRLYGTVDFTTPFPSRSKRFWFTSSTKCDYVHNPDLVSESTPDAAIKETIRNLSLSQDLRLQWKVAQGYTIGLNFSATWRNVSSYRQDFSTISAVDLRSGLTANLRLPGDVILATDISVTDRMGYEDNALNNTDWIWNARVERSWLNGRLTAKVDAYDILNRINNVNVRINSLGRTETWTNSMSRYVLLTLAWRFSIMPQK
ncbi:MAG: hypothetical protein HFJ93_06470 [Muribaculaceae bacterium]|jgi:hypothetical protein|nr:hypothetical protein [Muribaculaceae bacterium]